MNVMMQLLIPSSCVFSTETLGREEAEQMMQLVVVIQGYDLILFVDSGSTHSLLNEVHGLVFDSLLFSL